SEGSRETTAGARDTRYSRDEKVIGKQRLLHPIGPTLNSVQMRYAMLARAIPQAGRLSITPSRRPREMGVNHGFNYAKKTGGRRERKKRKTNSGPFGPL